MARGAALIVAAIAAVAACAADAAAPPRVMAVPDPDGHHQHRRRGLQAGTLPSPVVTVVSSPSGSRSSPPSPTPSPGASPSRIADYARHGYVQFGLSLALVRVDGAPCVGLTSWLLASGAGNVLRALLADAFGVSLWQVLVVNAADNAGAFVSNAPGSALAALNGNYFVPIEAQRCAGADGSGGSGGAVARRLQRDDTADGGNTTAWQPSSSQQHRQRQRQLQDLTDGVDVTLTVRVTPFDVRTYAGPPSTAAVVTRLTGRLMALDLRTLMRSFFSE